jgi:hypothetical protein
MTNPWHFSGGSSPAITTGMGMYRVELELLPLPEKPEVVAWLEARAK